MHDGWENILNVTQEIKKEKRFSVFQSLSIIAGENDSIHNIKQTKTSIFAC